MARTIEFEEQDLVVHLTGLVHYESLTTELRIPYASIVGVSTAPFVPPKGTTRYFGTDVPFTDIHEGRYAHAGDWYFLSVEDRRKAVTLTLENFSHGDRREPLKVVVLGTHDPEGLAAGIRAHLPARPAGGGPASAPPK